MKNIISYLRIKEWLDSKVTFMMGVLLFFYFCDGTRFEAITVSKIVAYFLYVSMFLAISYVANDFSDMEIDKKAGKEKIIAHMPRWGIWCTFILMAAVGNVPVLLFADDKRICAVMIITTYLLGLAYSIPGIRFKERGLWGLIECSFAQRCMPLLMIFALIKLEGPLATLLAGWSILSFIDGLRYIIIHQVNDLENDVATGVHTYVAEKKGNYRKILLLLLGTEIIVTGILLAPLWKKEAILTVLFVLLNAGLEYCIYAVIQKFAAKDIMLTYDSVPMEAFYNTLFPVLSGLCMVLLDIRWAVILIWIILTSVKSFMVKCRIVAVYIQSKMKTGR